MQNDRNGYLYLIPPLMYGEMCEIYEIERTAMLFLLGL